ncbi:unnamed protein product [Rhodiola kirilowii]
MDGSATMNLSPLDLLSEIFAQNPQLLMILTTSLVVLIGCVVLLFWRRSGSPSQRSSRPV